jgi:pilus assembly protein CpaB
MLVILLALPLALGAAFVARGMVAQKPKAVTVIAAPPKPTAQVLVAAHDLAVGDRVTADMLIWREWPVEGLNPAYISKNALPAAPAGDKVKIVETEAQKKVGDAKVALVGDAAKTALEGSVVRTAMLAGEPVATTKLVRGGDSGVMAVALTPGSRAMSVPLSAETGAAGFIQPGDHVDVVQTRKVDVEGKGAEWVANTVMKNVRVIAIDSSTKADSKAPVNAGATATLEVSPDQAEAIVLARVQGELTLVLRSYADAAGPTVEGVVHRAEAEQVPVVRVFRAGPQPDQIKVAR